MRESRAISCPSLLKDLYIQCLIYILNINEQCNGKLVSWFYWNGLLCSVSYLICHTFKRVVNQHEEIKASGLRNARQIETIPHRISHEQSTLLPQAIL